METYYYGQSVLTYVIPLLVMVTAFALGWWKPTIAVTPRLLVMVTAYALIFTTIARKSRDFLQQGTTCIVRVRIPQNNPHVAVLYSWLQA